MRRLLSLAAAMLALAAVPPTASGQVFSVVRSPQAALPSYTVPNAPGSIRTPVPLGAPPAIPAVRSYEQLLALWREAGRSYGVPWQVLAAINKIESNFGQNMGPSSAGALGWMQFIPSSWERWGMDADGDGLADPWDPEDAVYAAARYLAAAGAHENLERAIFAYNHAQWYVDDVLELAAVFGDDPLAPAAGQLVYRMADLDRRLGALRAKVARTQRALARAARSSGRIGDMRLELELRAGNPQLSDTQFHKLQARITRLGSVEGAREARRARLQSRLAGALAEIEKLQQEKAGVALAVPGALGASGLDAGGYVFPVGGGPALVSVAHDHHDYPAADIAAPEGSPLYALADAVVTETYPEGKGRCGTGFQLTTDRGAVFVYCHLSYLEPHVVPGAALAAGAPVGLVGSTGNSTGPHLHLAFVPALAYPQDEPWFQAFAGSAFRWQDGPSGPGAGEGETAAPPVFRVVRTRVVRFTP